MDPRILLFLAGLSCAFAASPFPKCIPAIVENIKQSWAFFGQPNLADILASTTGYVNGYKSTDGATIKPYSCKKYLVDNGKVTILLDGSSVEVTPTIKDGVISSDGALVYIMFNSNGVFGGYKCSEDGPEVSPDNPPLAGIFITEKYDPSTLVIAEGLMALAGFDLTKKFQC